VLYAQKRKNVHLKGKDIFFAEEKQGGMIRKEGREITWRAEYEIQGGSASQVDEKSPLGEGGEEVSGKGWRRMGLLFQRKDLLPSGSQRKSSTETLGRESRRDLILGRENQLEQTNRQSGQKGTGKMLLVFLANQGKKRHRRNWEKRNQSANLETRWKKKSSRMNHLGLGLPRRFGVGQNRVSFVSGISRDLYSRCENDKQGGFQKKPTGRRDGAKFISSVREDTGSNRDWGGE